MASTLGKRVLVGDHPEATSRGIAMLIARAQAASAGKDADSAMAALVKESQTDTSAAAAFDCKNSEKAVYDVAAKRQQQMYDALYSAPSS